MTENEPRNLLKHWTTKR